MGRRSETLRPAPPAFGPPAGSMIAMEESPRCHPGGGRAIGSETGSISPPLQKGAAEPVNIRSPGVHRDTAQRGYDGA